MRPRLWKTIAVLLVLLTLLAVQFIQGFHSVNSFGSTYKKNTTNPGTLLIVEAYPNVNVNFNVTLQYTGLQTGSAEIYLLNGTTYNLNMSHQIINVEGQLHGKWLGYQGGGGYGYVELNSTKNPVAIATVSGFSQANFTTQYLNSRVSGVNYFAVYVNNYVLYDFKAVAMTI